MSELPNQIKQMCNSGDRSRGLAALLHGIRGDVNGVGLVLEDAGEVGRSVELFFATVFGAAQIFDKFFEDDGRFEKELLDVITLLRSDELGGDDGQ